MKRKILLSAILANFLTLGTLSAQTQITLQGNVTVTDNPATPAYTEGDLTVSRNLTVSENLTTCGFTYTGEMLNIGWASLVSGGSYGAIENSFAWGYHSGANGGSFAFGNGSYAISESFAFGAQTFSFGGVVMGNYSTSYASSIVLGDNNSTCNSYSCLIGAGLSVSTYMQVVIGYYNVDITGDYAQWIDTDPLFVIGNGTAANRSNALVMLKNGDTTLNGHMTAKSYTVTEAAGGIPMGPFARQEQ